MLSARRRAWRPHALPLFCYCLVRLAHVVKMGPGGGEPWKAPQGTFLDAGFWAECATASQPQSPAIFWIADEVARNFGNEKQLWPFLIAKCIATATVSLPNKNCLLESGQACGHHLQLFNVGGLTIESSKIAVYSFDHENKSQTSTGDGALRFREGFWRIVLRCLLRGRGASK